MDLLFASSTIVSIFLPEYRSKLLVSIDSFRVRDAANHLWVRCHRMRHARQTQKDSSTRPYRRTGTLQSTSSIILCMHSLLLARDRYNSIEKRCICHLVCKEIQSILRMQKRTAVRIIIFFFCWTRTCSSKQFPAHTIPFNITRSALIHDTQTCLCLVLWSNHFYTYKKSQQYHTKVTFGTQKDSFMFVAALLRWVFAVHFNPHLICIHWIGLKRRKRKSLESKIKSEKDQLISSAQMLRCCAVPCRALRSIERELIECSMRLNGVCVCALCFRAKGN